MKKYLWCEDRGSGYQFWYAVFNSLYPEITVESKKGNTSLRKAAKNIISDGNIYFILMDNAVDNPDVLRENKRLEKDVAEKDNVRIIIVHSFEFALLSFELLEQWIFAEEDELKAKRQRLLNARALFIKLQLSGGNGTELSELKELLKNSDNKNTEKIAADLLFDITRNTGFETTKGKLGKCFINNCCEWLERQEDDICGLDSDRITAKEKVKLLVTRSVLQDAFRKVGL